MPGILSYLLLTIFSCIIQFLRVLGDFYAVIHSCASMIAMVMLYVCVSMIEMVMLYVYASMIAMIMCMYMYP